MQVVSILLGDSTAVISLQIWREAAMHFGSMLSSFNSTSDDSVPPLVRIERVFAKAEGRKCLTTTRKLEASDKMVVSKVSESMQDSAPSTQSSLDRSLLIADFFGCKMRCLSAPTSLGIHANVRMSQKHVQARSCEIFLSLMQPATM